MVGNKRLSIIARMDHSGLGHQTRDLVRMLKPDKVWAIDFRAYNNFTQHPEWYEDYNTEIIQGFINDPDIHRILSESDIVLTAETFYNNQFIDVATREGKITVNHVNYEFFEPLSNRSLLLPSKIVMPSYWHLEELQNLTLPGKVEYLPPPTFVEDYNEVREHNYNRTGRKRFLHVAGKMAAHDRAGTMDLIHSMRYSREDFELVIKIQSGTHMTVQDPRIILDYDVAQYETELYRNFDAMIQPRRYAGLNLPMNEALAAGLPVIMTDISPNNKILPQKWLVESHQVSTFVARTAIEVYSADPQRLGATLDSIATMNEDELKSWKLEAYQIAMNEYSDQILKQKWDLLLTNIGV